MIVNVYAMFLSPVKLIILIGQLRIILRSAGEMKITKRLFGEDGGQSAKEKCQVQRVSIILLRTVISSTLLGVMVCIISSTGRQDPATPMTLLRSLEMVYQMDCIFC